MDKKWLGAKTGMLAVLHTWGQNLSYHPHLHCLIPAGGLHPNGKDWVDSPNPNFFVKHKELQKRFKKTFLKLLLEAFETEQIQYIGKAAYLADIDQFRGFYAKLQQKRWVVRIEKPLPKSDAVFEYLAKYTHRIAMSDYRIQKLEKGRVYFDYKDYRSQKQGEAAPIKTTSLAVMEFIRRFLQHVLPKWFQKIRYYGIMATACRKNKLVTCQKGLKYSPALIKRTIQQILETIFGLELEACPACGSTNLVTLPLEEAFDWTASFLNLPVGRPPPDRIHLRVATPIF